MHLPDGLLSHSIALATYAGSLGVCAVAVVKANRDLDERQVPLLGMTGAFIFAAQMLNFPIAVGTTGHFMGAGLAAILLGPLNACLVLGLVLGIQCFLFGDGGLTALGANTFNMGVGMVVVCAASDLSEVQASITEQTWVIGELITAADAGRTVVLL